MVAATVGLAGGWRSGHGRPPGIEDADGPSAILDAWTSSTGATRCSRRCAPVARRASWWSPPGLIAEGGSRRSSAWPRDRGIPVEESSRRRLDDIAHTEHHQGIAGLLPRPAAADPRRPDRRARAPQLVVVLDGIQDPQNLGAITRTADAVGADGMVLPRHRAARCHGRRRQGLSRCHRARSGRCCHQPGAGARAAEGRRAVGGGARRGRRDRYDSFDFTGPVAVVIGAEGEGMRSLTRRHCDAVVSLPLAGRVSSLNAGAAAAVLLYEVARQRGFARRER